MWAWSVSMNKTSRAIRRHHRERLIRRCMNYTICSWNENDTEQERYDRASRVVDNIKVCSCSMCCNSRRNDWQSKNERLTIQERKELGRYEYDS